MKINFSDYDLAEFYQKEGVFCGVPAVLITPSLQGVQWTQANKIFRSSVWSLDGELLSGSFVRFTNLGENPEHFPAPNSLKNCDIVTKEDGSTFILDYVNRAINIRSRGTFNAQTLDNGDEFYEMLIKYPLMADYIKGNSHLSLLCEHVTPTNRIVIEYPEVDIFLIGAVNKENYSLLSQKKLDIIAKQIKVSRPKYHQFNSLNELVEGVKLWKGSEGVCIYGRNSIHKVKSLDYLKKHAFKSDMSFKNLLEVYLDQNEPNYNDFYFYVQNEFDWECAEMAASIISQLCDVKVKNQKIIDGMRRFIDVRRDMGRKDFAIDVMSSYGKATGRTGMVFALYDGKELTRDQKKKLYFQQIKN
jgi:hypothetical protein